MSELLRAPSAPKALLNLFADFEELVKGHCKRLNILAVSSVADATQHSSV